MTSSRINSWELAIKGGKSNISSRKTNSLFFSFLTSMSYSLNVPHIQYIDSEHARI